MATIEDNDTALFPGKFRCRIQSLATITRWRYLLVGLASFMLNSAVLELAWAQSCDGEACPAGKHCVIPSPGKPGHCVENPPPRSTIFVDWQNSGFQDGTAAHPYQTLPPTLAVAAPGDTIAIRTGSYSTVGGPLVFNKRATVRADNGLVTITASPAPGVQSVLTNNANNARTGFYEEFQLNPTNVNADALATFGKLFTWQTDGQIYAQPLYVHGVRLQDNSVHNVVYVATETNHVYAFDADKLSIVWEQVLGNPVLWGVGGCQHDKNLFPASGITSTPAIDVSNNTIFVVARTQDADGSIKYRLHAMDLGDGREKFGGPVVVGAVEPAFDPKMQLNRPGLLLSAGRVYTAFGSECDTPPFHGWVFGYDARSLQNIGVFNTTPGGEAGGIWQAGRGLAADRANNIYFMTGNGTVDFQNRNLGQSLIRLDSALRLGDWFTPGPKSSPTDPDDFRCLNGPRITDLFPRTGLAHDLDLGSSGPLLIQSASGNLANNRILGGGKGGKFYLLNSMDLGGSDHFHALDEIIATHSPEWWGVPCHAIVKTSGRDTHHIHGGPVLWASRTKAVIYDLGENDPLKAFEIVDDKISFVASSKFRAPPGMPGGILSVSGVPEDSASALVWATIPLRDDAVEHIVRGILVAFQANPNGSDIPLLWHSEMNAARDSVGLFAKYVPPTIAGGKVFVASFGDPSNPNNANNDDPNRRRIGQLHMYSLLRTP